MPLPILCDWVYATVVENMDKQQRAEFDHMLDGVLNARERRDEEREARRRIARLNART